MGRGFDEDDLDLDLLSLLGSRERINRLFGEQGFHPDQGVGAGWIPPVDIVDKGEAYILTAEVPGVDESVIDLQISGDTLVLRGARSTHQPVEGHTSEEGIGYHRLERPDGSFQRTFRLPDEVDPDKITAACADGVLRVELVKRVDSSGQTTIEVEVE